MLYPRLVSFAGLAKKKPRTLAGLSELQCQNSGHACQALSVLIPADHQVKHHRSSLLTLVGQPRGGQGNPTLRLQPSNAWQASPVPTLECPLSSAYHREIVVRFERMNGRAQE